MIYKLIYTNEAEAIADLLAKGVLVDINTYAQSTHAVVYIGKIVDTPAVVEDMEVITPATFIDGYHVDVMTDLEIEFENAVIPNNPKHNFYN
jgi:hypothetical protein